MKKYRGTVTITKTWDGVEVEADGDDDAEMKLLRMKEDELDKQSSMSEDGEVDDLECIEGCEEEEE
jgi:hypothetical protein